MSDNLISVILNQVLGAVIGTLTSIAISWYFYKKSDIFNRVADERLRNLERIEIEKKLGKIYEFSLRFAPPKDLDIPHIYQIWLDKNAIKPGGVCSMLFYVGDNGFNFLGVDGLEVIENTSQLSFPTVRQGHGYYSCEAKFPSNSPSGLHTISFTLKDRKGNINKQSFKIDVLPKSQSASKQ